VSWGVESREEGRQDRGPLHDLSFIVKVCEERRWEAAGADEAVGLFSVRAGVAVGVHCFAEEKAKNGADVIVQVRSCD
jgi:hypothetical protein